MIFFSGSAFLFIATIATVGVNKRMRAVTRSKQALGLTWLDSMRVFLSRVQKHRGLSVGYLKGETALLAQVERLQSSIVEDIAKIEAEGIWMQKNERWIGIVEHWQRLSKNVLELEVSESFKQHHWLIQNTLYLIEDMADEHSLLRLKGPGKKDVEYLWKDLLQLIEYMGQARAIGTGVAVEGRCSSVDRIKLNYLYKKIEIGAAAVADDLENKSEPQAQASRLLDYIENKILAAHCEVSPSEYFAATTEVLESFYAQYDSCLDLLKKR